MQFRGICEQPEYILPEHGNNLCYKGQHKTGLDLPEADVELGGLAWQDSATHSQCHDLFTPENWLKLNLFR